MPNTSNNTSYILQIQFEHECTTFHGQSCLKLRLDKTMLFLNERNIAPLSKLTMSDLKLCAEAKLFRLLHARPYELSENVISLNVFPCSRWEAKHVAGYVFFHVQENAACFG